MISSWFKHLKTKEEQERFKNEVLGSKQVLKRLEQILSEYDTESLNQSNDYDNPNWAYRQADSNGFRRCVATLKKLINLDHKE